MPIARVRLKLRKFEPMLECGDSAIELQFSSWFRFDFDRNAKSEISIRSLGTDPDFGNSDSFGARAARRATRCDSLRLTASRFSCLSRSPCLLVFPRTRRACDFSRRSETSGKGDLLQHSLAPMLGEASRGVGDRTNPFPLIINDAPPPPPSLIKKIPGLQNNFYY